MENYKKAKEILYKKLEKDFLRYQNTFIDFIVENEINILPETFFHKGREVTRDYVFDLFESHQKIKNN